MKKKILVIVLVIIIAALAAGAWFLFFNKKSKEAEDKSKPLAAPVPVKTVRSWKGDLPLYISSSGKLEAIRVNDYIAEVTGNVNIKVKEGQFVQKGTLLFTIDNPTYQINYEKALLEYKKAYIQYLAISEDVESVEGFAVEQKDLYSDDSEVAKIQQDVVEGLQKGTITRERIKYRLGEQELALKQALENYKKCSIRAPFSGVVGKIAAKQGEYLQAGSAVLSIADITRLRIKAKILVKDINQIKEGATAVIFPVVSDEKYSGRVYSVNPLIYDDNSTYAVVELDNRKGDLYPGVFCDVLLQVDLIKDKVLVPKEAVLERDGKKLVFVVKNGLGYWTYVDVGPENYQYIVIEDKLDAGEEIIVEGHYVLNHKAAVTVVNNEDAAVEEE
ncbi:MAG TPA: efflux RND transporter periplasmic adaptor subunit [Candidatus Mcinerneyibacteriales bacterium]|nr:efflux RND transporter periplasmic adaptor subunit [Candidatus Mcinerneyibacteriales bacterium]HPE19912.1 efflux RND transporter periplasmic adaptor subunit [Candidatus Mcinerneyibacteriales bacterium]HPJ69450.1 efflux RND transporter periplasmic adaptor subunit [Candidatus Mcinerneyibacteriales bacterium]HPQ88567.1 efflux RND transporter periplasmic adaptor subunit [Candidatus Mcinerneyibacteriales bacterium]